MKDIASSSSVRIPKGSYIQEDIRVNFRDLDIMEALLRDTMDIICQLGGQELD